MQRMMTPHAKRIQIATPARQAQPNIFVHSPTSDSENESAIDDSLVSSDIELYDRR